MAFEILNEAASVLYVLAGVNRYPQAEPDKVDIDILAQGVLGEGVISGCAVTPQGIPDMTVAVAAGVVRIGGTDVVYAGGNVNCGAAHAGFPRFDLIAINNAGVASAVAGVAAAPPVFPAVPANSVIVAAVWRAANDNTITAADIVDKRCMLGSNTLDQAYDQGGAGAGRQIDVVAGLPVLLNGQLGSRLIEVKSNLAAAASVGMSPAFGFEFGDGAGVWDLAIARFTAPLRAVSNAGFEAAQFVSRKTTLTIDANAEITVPLSSWVYLTKAGGGPHDLSGIGAGIEGQVVILTPTAGKDITLIHNSGATVAGQPLMINGEANVLFDQDHDMAIAVYDAVAAVWNVLVPGAGGGAPHNLLDGVTHPDTVAQAVSVGSIVYGDNTPNWNELLRSVPGAPALRNALGLDQGDTIPAWKVTLDGVNPADIAAAAGPGTSLIYAHRDHVHAHPNLGDLHQGYILASGIRAFTGAQSMGGFVLSNVAAPVLGGDAANKTYVDARKIAHCLVFACPTDELDGVVTFLPECGICVGEPTLAASGEHGDFTAVPRGKAACLTAGVGGTCTILIEADNAPTFGTPTTLYTLPLNVANEVDDVVLDNPWGNTDIWVRARCSAWAGYANNPTYVFAYFYFWEEVS